MPIWRLWKLNYSREVCHSAIYQTNRFPYSKYRVTVWSNREGLKWRTKDTDFEGKEEKGGAWSFRAVKGAEYVIDGPKLRRPLQQGKYRAMFRMKVNEVDAQTDRFLCQLEVISWAENDYPKLLVGRDLTIYDFKKADKYEDFPLDFKVFAKDGEFDLEFRIKSWNSVHQVKVTLDYVQLSRKRLS